MNDPQRLSLGILGTVLGWVTLESAATAAALLASLATAVFMAISAIEKARALRAARRAEVQTKFPFVK